MFQHLAASGGAIAAGFGAALHVLIIGEFLAGSAASITCFGTTFTDHSSHWPAMGNDLGGRGTELGAVCAGAGSNSMVFLAGSDEVGAVPHARLAFAHAVGTGLGALIEVRRMLVMLLFVLCPGGGAGSQQKSADRKKAQSLREAAIPHDLPLSW
jgi:hypothetical protein